MTTKTVIDAVNTIRHCEDAIEEINAMIPRLYIIQKQLKKQADFTKAELTTNASSGSTAINADIDINDNILAYKHETLKNNTGGKYEAIFTGDFVGDTTTKAGLEVIEAKHFLCAINSVLCHKNADSGANGTLHPTPSGNTPTSNDCIVPSSVPQSAGTNTLDNATSGNTEASAGIESIYYKPGGIHIMNEHLAIKLLPGVTTSTDTGGNVAGWQGALSSGNGQTRNIASNIIKGFGLT